MLQIRPETQRADNNSEKLPSTIDIAVDPLQTTDLRCIHEFLEGLGMVMPRFSYWYKRRRNETY
jgi:hypothetical protein